MNNVDENIYNIYVGVKELVHVLYRIYYVCTVLSTCTVHLSA